LVIAQQIGFCARISRAAFGSGVRDGRGKPLGGRACGCVRVPATPEARLSHYSRCTGIPKLGTTARPVGLRKLQAHTCFDANRNAHIEITSCT